MSSPNIHFSISERKVFLRLSDMLFIGVGLYGASAFFDFKYFNFNNKNIVLWFIVLLGYFNLFAQIFELLDLKVSSDRYQTFKSVVVTVIFTTLFFVFTPKISPVLPNNRIQIVYFALTIFSAVMFNRLLYILLIFSPLFAKNILVIANNETIRKFLAKRESDKSTKVVAYISDSEMTDIEGISFVPIKDFSFEKIIMKYGINEILVSSRDAHHIPKHLHKRIIEIFEKGMSIRSIDSFIEKETLKISEDQLVSNFYNYFSFSTSHENNLYLAFRRVTDIVLSLLGILFFLSLLPLVLIVNQIGNRGGLFYTQDRVGKRGRIFRIIKFRTMRPNAEKNGAQWASKGDNRITPFGRVLRKTRIDEVPQFINILKGEMSIIGSRAERPEFVRQLEKELPYYALRHVIKPGLTGWAQVMHPYASTVEDQREKLMYDLYYIKEQTLIMDLKIVMKTISTVLFMRGT